jgi:hypothetical protein
MPRPQIQSNTSENGDWKFSILDIRWKRTAGFLSSAVLGYAVILVDFPVEVKTKILLGACLSLWSVLESGSHLLTAIVISFGSFCFTSNLFHCLALWHLLPFLAPIIHHMQGIIPDDQCLESVSKAEWLLSFYLAPTLALHLLQFVWSSIGTIIAVSIFVCGTLLFCSRERRETLLGKPFNKLLDLYCWYHPTTYNFYFYVCDALVGTFNRWGVSIARRRMEDRPTLPNRHLSAHRTL